RHRLSFRGRASSATKRSAKLNLPLQNSLFHKSVAAFIQAQQATSKKNAEAPFHFFHHKRLISPNKIRIESKILPQKLGIFQNADTPSVSRFAFISSALRQPAEALARLTVRT
ncbi:MAG: hypothetical protein J6V45_05730, partial [Kiritimatiellae bacterium]|nr:hypothetical protein [Kiritimatiellia bacterium]